MFDVLRARLDGDDPGDVDEVVALPPEPVVNREQPRHARPTPRPIETRAGARLDSDEPDLDEVEALPPEPTMKREAPRYAKPAPRPLETRARARLDNVTPDVDEVAALPSEPVVRREAPRYAKPAPRPLETRARGRLDNDDPDDVDEPLEPVVNREAPKYAKPASRPVETRGPAPRTARRNAPRRDKAREPLTLDVADLAFRRIVAFDGADNRSLPYDLLRAQLLRLMARKKWRLVGLSSPTEGCGKTVTAINLAFSAARNHDHGVLLVDMNLHQPKIADYLDFVLANGGVLDLLENRATFEETVVPVSAGSVALLVLPTASASDPSAVMSSDALSDFFQGLREAYPHHIVVIDLPPVLTSDDALAALPEIDCHMLVAAAGTSKVAEVEKCLAYLPKGQLARVVVNKTDGAA